MECEPAGSTTLCHHYIMVMSSLHHGYVIKDDIVLSHTAHINDSLFNYVQEELLNPDPEVCSCLTLSS